MTLSDLGLGTEKMPSLVEIGKVGCLAPVPSMLCVCRRHAPGLPVLVIQGFGVVMCLTHGGHAADSAEVGQVIEEGAGPF